MVTIDDMRDKLHDLDWLQSQLSGTEPLATSKFDVSGVNFRLDETDAGGKQWHDRELQDPAPAWLEIPGSERVQLTRQAVSQLASECHLPRNYQAEVPSWLLTQNMNWWLGTGLGERSLQALVAGLGTYPAESGDQQVPLARAICRSTIIPFSNLNMLEVMAAQLRKKYGDDAEILVDYKFHHDLEATAFRLIVPEGLQRVITGTPVEGDIWSTGIQFKNSLIGLKQTELSGYLFRWACTNGAIDTLASSGGFMRRKAKEADALSWAAEQVDSVLGGLEHTLDEVQEMVAVPVTGDTTTILADLFARHSLPVREQQRIIAAMADTSDMTMYGLMQAITQVANMDGLDRGPVESLMAMGGHVLHSAAAGRCGNCRRLLPEGWELTHPDAGVHDILDQP